VVNNVETLCCVARALERGSGWFAQFGTKGSTGTKLLSVSGDCLQPGVYEVEFGTALGDLLKLVGARDAAAVQVGGPSGTLVGPEEYHRTICFDDLSTGGSMMVFGQERDLLDVVRQFLAFFCEESCGYCTPCRVGNHLLKERVEHILAGKGQPEDLSYLEELANVVRTTSRCGLGQTSPNPVLSLLKGFRPMVEARVKPPRTGALRRFDLRAALATAEAIAGRRSTVQESTD
jgi:[NiFe] hydrogenase diaphorase moiety large subunit